jgi:YD repeat-containing protein
VVNGQTGTFSGITSSYSYDSRLFPTAISATSFNGTALSLSYSYFANGNVNVETNGRDNGRTATYTYDALSRVTSGKSQATSGSDCWGQTVPTGGYDRYGNLLTINSSQCSNPTLSLSVNTSNHITNSGFTYDAAGNLTGDGTGTGTYSYTWDAEGRLATATTPAGGTSTSTYTYNALGERVPFDFAQGGEQSRTAGFDAQRAGLLRVRHRRAGDRAGQ